MSQRGTSFGRSAEVARDAPGGPPLRGILASDYIGEMAADAAQAIRRAGLRPGLERSLGCEPELLGLVVAQEPAAGTELARNAMVTLYVAARGPAPAPEPSAGDPAGSFDATPPSNPVSQALDAEDGVRRSEPSRRRRRKSRPGAQPRTAFATPLVPLRQEAPVATTAPSLPATEPPTGEWAEAHEAPSVGPPDSHTLADPASDDDGHADVENDEFLVHANDVFAGRAGVSWRRVYPASRRRTRSGHDRRWAR
jgi:hypothetical protein